MNKKSRNSAFTLIEMMIVIAIISIAVSIAIPNIIDWLPEQRLKSATRDLISSMQEAKLQAIKENGTVTLVFDPSGTPPNYFFDTKASYDAWQAGEKRVDLADYKSGIDFGSGGAANDWNTTPKSIDDYVTFTSDKVGFTSRGFGTSGTVFLHNKNNDICFAITVLTTGSIKLRKYNGATWTD